MMPPTHRRRLGFAAASLLWLPAGIVVLTLVRGFGLPPEAHSWLLLAVTAPCGLPLALAWLALHSAGWRRAAWTVFAVLGPLTVLGALAGGLLGPVGVAGYTVVSACRPGSSTPFADCAGPRRPRAGIQHAGLGTSSRPND